MKKSCFYLYKLGLLALTGLFPCGQIFGGNMATTNYYEVLEIDRGASKQEIKKAYRQMAFRHHPDRNMGNSYAAEEKFKLIQEAWSILGNPKKREEYDLLGQDFSSSMASNFYSQTQQNSAFFQILPVEMKQAERIEFYGEKVSIVLELSPEGDIQAIHFDMYEGSPQYYDGRHRTKRIPIKDFFEKTFESPQVYGGTDQKISPISFHPLDFNPKDGGTFAIKFKNRHFFKSFSTSKEVVMSLVKNGGKWILADEEPILEDPSTDCGFKS